MFLRLVKNNCKNASAAFRRFVRTILGVVITLQPPTSPQRCFKIRKNLSIELRILHILTVAKYATCISGTTLLTLRSAVAG